MNPRKPKLRISLSGTERNAFAIIAKAQSVLEEADQQEQARALTADFTRLTRKPGSTYEQVKKLAEKYCHVTWLT